MTTSRSFALADEHIQALAGGLLEAISCGVVFLSADGTVTAANLEAVDAVGMPSTEVVGRKLAEFEAITVREDGTPFPAAEFPVLRALATGEAQPSATIGIRRPDGRLVWLYTRALPLKDPRTGHTVGAVATFADISDRKRAEEELRWSRELLRKTQELARVGSWEWDARTNQVRWTEAMFEIHGITKESFGGTLEAAMAFVHPDDVAHVWSAMSQLEPGAKGLPVEYRIVRPDGTERRVWALGEKHFDEAGQVLKMVGAVQDVTERHLLETHLRQVQRMESIGQLAGGIAHDFNNLLQPILGNAELALSGGDPVPALTEIRMAAERAAELTQELLAFARRQPHRPVPLDLNAVVEQFLRLLPRMLGKQVQVRFRPGAQVPGVLADRSQLEQVLMNLSINARDAMPQGGNLTIETRRVKVDDGFRRQRPWATEAAYVELAVSDTGLGIPIELQPRIFEPFFSTKEPNADKGGGGTGLGLAVVYGIVQRHRGAIEVESAPGHGATFRIYLPATEEAVTGFRGADPVGAAPGGHETILLVDDQEMVRTVTSRLLRAAGYRVLEAADYEGALALFAAYEDEIALVFTDVMLVGQSGPDLARKLRERRRPLPIVFATGYAENAAQTLQGERVVDKPFSTQTLLTAVRQALDARPGSTP